MEKEIKQISEQLYKDMETFFRADLTPREQTIAMNAVSQTIRNTVIDTGNYISRVLSDSVNKAK